MKKIFAAMNRPQKALTAAAFTLALACALVVVTLVLEAMSGRLDRIYDPDFRGSVVINELPERLPPESNPILASFNLGRGAPYSHQLSFTYDELDDWLWEPCPSDNYPMSVIVDLSEQHSMGINLFNMRTDLTPIGTGDFYIVLSRSVVEEMRQLLKGTDEPYTFEVELSPINFNSAELALRSVLNSLYRQYNHPIDTVILMFCVALGLLGFGIIRLWKREIYYPVRFDVTLFEEDEDDRPGRWS